MAARGLDGLTLDGGIKDLALDYLATVQALAYGTRQILEAMRAKGANFDTLVVSGGLAKNALYLREHADATGCRILVPDQPEPVLLGAAMLGAAAAGDFNNLPAAMAAMSGKGSTVVPRGGGRCLSQSEVSSFSTHAGGSRGLSRHYEYPGDIPMTKIALVASGDLRESANILCWPAQQAMEKKLTDVLAALGHDLVRAHPVKSSGHGFIASQREGMDVFAGIDPQMPLIVAEAVWQYSHHVLAGLCFHKGPILTVANWSGQWPGLVGLLNLNGSLSKAGVSYASLWSADFDDTFFLNGLEEWLESGKIKQDQSHIAPFDRQYAGSEKDDALAVRIADDLRRNKSIMGSSTKAVWACITRLSLTSF
ncbi:FGGY-family carbohydrate kinase [Sulfitobacter pacificus]|uniref:FGGY-family carbohydrate kinase n=1 Tax=Sulfitobacter pacificus TaxID=1499314 RepID=UPI00360D6375